MSKPPKCELIGESGDLFDDLYVVLDGKKIAKRGHPGTPQAGTWTSIEPGYVVRDVGNLEEIEVEYDGQRIH